MKTPYGSLCTTKLANLNDQLCFSLFSREELTKKLKDFSPIASKLYTTDLFINNPYAKKIHVPIEKLPEFITSNASLSLGAYFSFSYELLFGYIEEVMALITQLNAVTLTPKQKKGDIETKLYFLIRNCNRAAVPDVNLIRSIAYFRLRRNHFTHMGDSLKEKFQTLLNKKGKKLNEYWKGSKTNLDFTRHSMQEYTAEETIELIKLIRIVLERIDSCIVGILDKKGIAKLVTQNIYKNRPSRINADIVKERKKTVKSLTVQYYGITLTDDEMDTAVRTICAR